MTGTVMRQVPTAARRLLRERVALPLLALLVAAAACDRGAGAGAEGVDADTAGVEGLSQEELQQQAQPMSPEQAQQAGIVDTSKAPPSPIGPQSSIPGAATDTTASPTVAP